MGWVRVGCRPHTSHLPSILPLSTSCSWAVPGLWCTGALLPFAPQMAGRRASQPDVHFIAPKPGITKHLHLLPIRGETDCSFMDCMCLGVFLFVTLLTTPITNYHFQGGKTPPIAWTSSVAPTAIPQHFPRVCFLPAVPLALKQALSIQPDLCPYIPGFPGNILWLGYRILFSSSAWKCLQGTSAWPGWEAWGPQLCAWVFPITANQ